MKTKSNVFNIQLKYPSLKQAYDLAEGKVKENLSQQQRDMFSEKESYRLRKKQAELRKKRFEKISVYESDDDLDHEEKNQNKRVKFISNC